MRFEVADAAKFRRDSRYGQLVTNPPYGERLMERQEAEELYRMLGRVWRTLPEGWRTLVLSSHTEFERAQKPQRVNVLEIDALLERSGRQERVTVCPRAGEIPSRCRTWVSRAISSARCGSRPVVGEAKQDSA